MAGRGTRPALPDLHEDDPGARRGRDEAARAPAAGREEHRPGAVLGAGAGRAVPERDRPAARRVDAREDAPRREVGVAVEADIEDGESGREERRRRHGRGVYGLLPVSVR